jgi:hypothetical protein
MRKKYLAKTFAIGLAVAAAASASAQFSPRIGLVFPANGGGSTALGFGLDYKLSALPGNVSAGGTATYWSLVADYYSHGGFSNLPIDLAFNFGSKGLTFFGAGGIEFEKTGGGTGSGLDLQAGVTYALSNLPLPAFLQAKYFLSSKSDLRGIGIYAGVKL